MDFVYIEQQSGVAAQQCFADKGLPGEGCIHNALLQRSGHVTGGHTQDLSIFVSNQTCLLLQHHTAQQNIHSAPFFDASDAFAF